jgi:folate-binding protein YgfZ
LQLPGAVPAEGVDAPTAWHYGDPTAEQRALTAGTARVDLSHRGVLRVEGPDRLSWLHSLTTQQLLGLPPHTSTETLVLSPKGHIEHAVHLVDDGTATWLTVEPGTAAALQEWLRRMQFMLRVEVQDVTAEWAVIGEPVSRESEPGEPLAWRDPWPAVAVGSVSYAAAEEHPGWAWREVLVPRSAPPPVAPGSGGSGDSGGPGGSGGSDGVRAAGSWALDALRVAAWRPRLGFETDHRTIPHELDWLRTAVHLSKGCYRGQETVARVHNLGRPPRRLVLLHLDGSEHSLPPVGTPVRLPEAGAGRDAGREIGRVTTSARHHELGPIALAVVKRSVPPDAVLDAGGIAASQELIVRP